jgi:thioredoxin-like negative regulator of GroEL
MGSATSNAELEKELALLNDILAGKVPFDQISPLLSRVVPKEIAKKIPIAQGPDRDIWIAELYFGERRFIESAHILSRLLDEKPKYPRARNLLARCFYFLGNPDRTSAELEYILTHQSGDAEEVLDALFLMGAAALESTSASPKILKKGIGAWETYLKVAPQSELRQKVASGLGRLQAKLKEQHGFQNSKVVQKPVTKRVARLSSKASAQDRLRAEGLDAFDDNDLLLAEKKLKQNAAHVEQDPESATALARIYIKTGRVSEALARFIEVTKRFPGHVPAWHYKGMAHIMSGDPKQAVESWTKVVAKDPKYADEFKLHDRIAVAKSMLK